MIPGTGTRMLNLKNKGVGSAVGLQITGRIHTRTYGMTEAKAAFAQCKLAYHGVFLGCEHAQHNTQTTG